jgi:hypothetical protein
MMSVQPVAQGGIEAKIGAKKMEMKKQRPVVMAVRPVLPPSEIPAPDSMKAVTGERPKREPIEIPKAGLCWLRWEGGNGGSTVYGVRNS